MFRLPRQARWQVRIIDHPLCSFHAAVYYDGKLRWVTAGFPTEIEARESAAAWILGQRMKLRIARFEKLE